MTRFLLIRHASTDMAARGLAGRASGVHLNDVGRIEAEQLAARLKALSIAAVYSSPMERALQTALPLSNILEIDCVNIDDFVEIDFGKWTGLSFEELKTDPAFQLFNSFRSFTPVPGGEFMAEAQLRVVKGMKQLFLRHPDETVVVVSHADVIKAAVAYFAGIHLDMFQRIEISPASVTIIEVYDETARIMLVNHRGEISF